MTWLWKITADLVYSESGTSTVEFYVRASSVFEANQKAHLVLNETRQCLAFTFGTEGVEGTAEVK